MAIYIGTRNYYKVRGSLNEKGDDKMGGFNLEHLEAARFYLFVEVKFLHFLLLLMLLDVITGIFKAIKNKNLWSRKSLFGYARKILVLVVIILANVIDKILGLQGRSLMRLSFFILLMKVCL